MKRVYLDYAATTPIDKKVSAEMAKIQKKFWANPSSLHEEGEEAKKVLEEARLKIARILHCRTSEVYFTSGGTEGLNLAILGIIQRCPLTFLPHVIVSTIEHPAVLEPIKNLVKNGEAEASFVCPDRSGRVSPESIKKEIKENTVLVAIQHTNNEIGIIQPIREISKILKSLNPHSSTRTPYLLVDACQSALYEDVSVERLGADILVLDGMKIYGPRGAGVLVVKNNVKISPIFFGGGQEGGLRSGTENVVNAVGLAKALEIAAQKREKESKRLTILRDYAIEKILKEIPHSFLNGSLENRLPNNINMCFSHSQGEPNKLDSEFLVIKLDTLGFAVSAASACNALKLENGSYVIESLGNPNCGSSSLRFTLGCDTKKSDLDKLISTLKKIIK